MFNFFKRKKDKKKRGGRKERGQEVGVTARRGDGQFATPAPVVSGESASADQSEQEVDNSGSGAPEVMGNDISKPMSSLQGLPEIPFIEIDPVERVNKLPTEEDVKAPQPITTEIEKKEQEMKNNMNGLSQLQSPYLVKRVSELENMEKPITKNFENSAKCESVEEKYVICDEASPANETVEEKSVTGDDDSLARKGSVASCEEYSPGEGEPFGTGNDREMYRISQGGALACGEVYDRLKSSSEGDVYSLKKGCEIVKSNLPCTDDQESGESSEGELSESEQSESDNIIKNDSGCWDQRESSLNLNENESQASQVTSPYSQGGIIENSKGKKRVKWADIDGKRKLTDEREGSIISSEESSEEESDDEEPEREKDDDEEDESEDEEEDDSVEEEESKNLIKVKIIDKTVKDNLAEPESESSSEEDSEEEQEGITSFNEVMEQPMAENIIDRNKEKDSEEESEESSAEESGNEDELNDDKNPLKIDIAEMQNRIADLQRDISLKASNIDRLQVELDAACNESEMVRKRFKRLEADLDLYKETNRELEERINVSATQVVEKEVKNSKKLEEAERQIKGLEAELAQVKSELSSLQTSYKKLEADRDMEVQIIQKALEKALTDQEEMEAKYEKEFENLRTLNSSREVQMLEDFEWKLREVQKACKKKMQDLETVTDKKSSELIEKLAAAQANLEQISHLKLCEIELNQLKQTSSEQRKNLRLTNRKLEELQVSEKILQEEVHSLRASLDKEKSHVATLQALHREELIEKERRAKLKLEVQINQLATEWEERLRRENFKVKTDTERTLREEKNSAVELVKKLKDQEITQLKQTWEKKSQDLKKEIENYKKKISEMEDLKKIDFDKIQTNADREIFDLRRKMDKLDMSYQEKIEKIQEQHEKEMAALKEECDRRVQQSEANLQLQVGNSRTTIELVKQQQQNEAQLKLEHLEREYENKLQQQWERLNQEKEEALEKMEQSQKQSLELLYMEIEKMKKHSKTDLEGKKKNQPSNQSPRMSSSQKKNSNDVSHSRNPISTRLDVAEVAEEIRTQGKEEVLQKSIEQLTKQLNAGKMEIEKLRQQLESRESARQQRTPPQPLPNPRRNRKPRSDEACMYL